MNKRQKLPSTKTQLNELIFFSSSAARVIGVSENRDFDCQLCANNSHSNYKHDWSSVTWQPIEMSTSFECLCSLKHYEHWTFDSQSNNWNGCGWCFVSHSPFCVLTKRIDKQNH